MSDRYHSINWGNCAQEARNCARPPSFASPPSCSSSASGSAEKATAAERLFDMAVQKQEAAQKKMEEAREIERKTKVYVLPLCTFEHCLLPAITFSTDSHYVVRLSSARRTTGSSRQSCPETEQENFRGDGEEARCTG